MDIKQKFLPEVLAPCGGTEALTAALRCGADAVYLGGAGFSARQNAANFSPEELRAAVFEAHKRGVKVYQAVNTVVFDDELPRLGETVRFACEIGVDALIVQDWAAAEIVRACCPEMPLHASTQMTIFSENGVLFVKEQGFVRAVLARELPVDRIKQLSNQGIETEVFLHGALCMCVSGQCYMSAMIGSRSANRGLCAQACRLPFSACQNPQGAKTPSGNGAAALSLKDLSALSHLEKLGEAGVRALKIEGRMKRPEYVAAAVTAVRQSLSGETPDTESLRAVFSRSGFTDGYLTGKIGGEMFGARRKEDVLSAQEVLPRLRELYRKEHKCAKIRFSVKISADGQTAMSASDGAREVEITAQAQPARTRPADKAYVLRFFEKLGDTIYEWDGLVFENAGSYTFSAAELNSARRRLCELLDHARAEGATVQKSFDPAAFRTLADVAVRKNTRNNIPYFRIELRDGKAAEGLPLTDKDILVLPLGAECPARLADRLMAALPRFYLDEAVLVRNMEAAARAGTTRFLVTNLAQIRICKAHGWAFHTDFGMNVTNSVSLNKMGELGADSVTVSPEITAAQFAKLGTDVARGMVAYGRLAVMLTANCPVKVQMDCSVCKGTCGLGDRTGRFFPVRCWREYGYTEIYNAEPIVLADRLGEFPTADFFALKFTTETPEEMMRILADYRRRQKPDIAKYTRGLYYRGVE